MTLERRPSQGQEHWKPKADFFKSTPRSAELHEVCGDILKKVDSLYPDGKSAQDEAQKQTLNQELKTLGTKLRELGIKPRMNDGMILDAYKSNPVTAMEWVAGQLYSLTGVEAKNNTEKLRSAVVEQGFIKGMYKMLDIPQKAEK
jgi:hypothetical protein